MMERLRGHKNSFERSNVMYFGAILILVVLLVGLKMNVPSVSDNLYLQPADLVAYWDLEDDLVDGIANDVSANGLDLTCSGNECPDLDNSDYSVGSGSASFDGIIDRLIIPHDPSFLIDSGSISFWFMPKSDNPGVIFSKDASGFEDGGHITIYSEHDPHDLPQDLFPYNSLTVRIQGVDSESILSTPEYSVGINQWNHGVITFGPGGLKLYLNGILESEDLAWTSGLGTSAGGLGNQEYLGVGVGVWRSSTGTIDELDNFFQGNIDDVGIYSRELSASEISNIHSSNSPLYVSSSCGDGIVDEIESCDDGNLNSGDGCSSSCDLEPGCIASPIGFESYDFQSTQTGDFTFEFDASPSGSNIDSLIGLTKGDLQSYDDYAVSIRFAQSGIIDVRDLNSYKADSVVNYIPGDVYGFRFEVDIDSKIFDVYVTPQSSGVEIQLANDYRFRETQQDITSIDAWGLSTDLYGNQLIHYVCNAKLIEGAVPNVPEPSCGDGLCDAAISESCSTCVSDCGVCEVPANEDDPSITIDNVNVIENYADIDFTLANWEIGAMGSAFVNFRIDSEPEVYQFYGATLNKVLINGLETTKATWIDENTIRFNNLAPGTHTVFANLANPTFEDSEHPGTLVTFTISETVEESTVVETPAPPVVRRNTPSQWNDINKGSVDVSEQEVEEDVNKNDRIIFKYGGKLYYVGVAHVSASSATLELNSNQKRTVIGVRDSGVKQVDFDGDGKNDVSIEMVRIDSDSLTMRIESLIAPADVEEAKEGKGVFGLMIVIVSVLLIFVVVFFYLIRVFTKEE